MPKIMTLNIEARKHFERWLPVVATERPDILSLQEVFAVDVERIKQETGMYGHFVATGNVRKENQWSIPADGEWGVLLLTRLPIKAIHVHYYHGTGSVSEFVSPNSGDRVLIVAEIMSDEGVLNYGTTHFTWSKGGEIDDEQRADFARLAPVIHDYTDLIVAGDFNSPRGKEMFSLFKTILTDNLPSYYSTTLDENLHYAGKLDLVVDTIFSKGAYTVSDVRVIDGVSDHMALVGEVKVRQ